MRKGELTLEIGSLDDDGAGVGLAEDARVHVAGALPGERVRATVEHVSPHRLDAWARLLSLERAAEERVPPACRAYGACGGCTLEHLAYPTQLAFKTRRVAEALGANVAACVPAPRPLGYRNRSKLVYGRAGERLVLGAYAPRSHVLVDLSGCRVAEPPLDEVAETLRALLETHAVPPYDEATAEGTLRYAVLRVNHAGQVLAVLVTPRAWPEGALLARALRAARPEVVGVVNNVNPTRGNTLYGPEDVTLDGANVLDDRVGEVSLRLSATAFFQVNRDVAARMYADARVAAEAPASSTIGRVVDVFSGVGGLALTLAPDAREVIGIETHPGAVADAQASAERAGATHVRFVCADAAAGLRALDRADVVVLNPPRRGAGAQVMAEALRLAPRTLLYVSCSPDSLARDLRELPGYTLVGATPYDMLPQTPHVEVLAVLARGARRS